MIPRPRAPRVEWVTDVVPKITGHNSYFLQHNWKPRQLALSWSRWRRRHLEARVHRPRGALGPPGGHWGGGGRGLLQIQQKVRVWVGVNTPNKHFIWILTRQCSKLASWSRQRQQLVPPISGQQRPGPGVSWGPEQCPAHQRLAHLSARSEVTWQMMRTVLTWHLDNFHQWDFDPNLIIWLDSGSIQSPASVQALALESGEAESRVRGRDNQSPGSPMSDQWPGLRTEEDHHRPRHTSSGQK